MPDTGKPNPNQNLVRQLADVMDLPFILVGAVVIGAGLGYLLDRKLHTSPLLTLLLGLLGFIGGIAEVLRRLRRRNG